MGCLLGGTVAALLGGCVIGQDGEGPRFTGRVLSLQPHQICIGPNTTRPRTTCGSVPFGISNLPKVGQCVSLFAHTSDRGETLDWTAESLRLVVPDGQCRSS
jgi:hypothetical protein